MFLMFQTFPGKAPTLCTTDPDSTKVTWILSRSTHLTKSTWSLLLLTLTRYRNILVGIVANGKNTKAISWHTSKASARGSMVEQCTCWLERRTFTLRLVVVHRPKMQQDRWVDNMGDDRDMAESVWLCYFNSYWIVSETQNCKYPHTRTL